MAALSPKEKAMRAAGWGSDPDMSSRACYGGTPEYVPCKAALVLDAAMDIGGYYEPFTSNDDNGYALQSVIADVREAIKHACRHMGRNDSAEFRQAEATSCASIADLGFADVAPLAALGAVVRPHHGGRYVYQKRIETFERAFEKASARSPLIATYRRLESEAAARVADARAAKAAAAAAAAEAKAAAEQAALDARVEAAVAARLAGASEAANKRPRV